MSKRIIPKIGKYNKIDVVSFMKMKLKSNDTWAQRACVLLYDQQTPKEKRNHISYGHNMFGFDRHDAPLLSKIACKIKRYQVTIQDTDLLKILIPKYSKQIICLSDEKELIKHLDIYYKRKKIELPF